ncbi:MAG: CopG family transcriptional regulator [Alphaproteobacteria bacterium]|nr:CopG family transcriptional regulator [Alphaproteobacteria bacterium]
MRTIIDLPESQLIPLDQLARQEDVSRAELVRQAVALLLKTRMAQTPVDLKNHPVFGMWKDNPETQDAVEYQRRLRAEWDS